MQRPAFRIFAYKTYNAGEEVAAMPVAGVPISR